MPALLLGIILGSVYFMGTRDTSSNQCQFQQRHLPAISSVPSETKASQIPTFAPLKNNLCQEANPILLGDDAIVAALEKASKSLSFAKT
jgi:hypothetical protein